MTTKNLSRTILDPFVNFGHLPRPNDAPSLASSPRAANFQNGIIRPLYFPSPQQPLTVRSARMLARAPIFLVTISRLPPPLFKKIPTSNINNHPPTVRLHQLQHRPNCTVPSSPPRLLSPFWWMRTHLL